MAKKVNTGFLIGLTAVVGGLAVGAFALFYFSRHTSKYFLDHSLAEEKKGNTKVAWGYMASTIGKDPGNKVLYIRQGDLAARLVTEDARFLGNSEASYRRALEIDPAYPDAIDRLLKNDIGRARAGLSGPAFFKELKDVADKGVASDSANAHYATWSAIATLHPWIFSNSPVSPAIERTGTALSDIAAKHPEEYDAAFYASLFDMRRVQQLRSLKQDDQAKAVLDLVSARHQAALKARPQDPGVQLRASQIFREIAQVDADHKVQFTAQAKAALSAAGANVHPDDDLFDEISHWQIVWMQQDKASREEIESAYNAWTAARPHDAFVRLEHAQYLGLDPAHRGDAIALLSTPVTPDPSVTGFAAVQAKGNERATLVLLNNFRADDATIAKPEERAKLLASIDQDLGKIQEIGLGEDPALLKLRGKSQMLHDQPIDALSSFIKAQAMLGANVFEADLWIQLQRAYLVTGQTGSAQRMMEDALQRFPANTDLRIRLARLYQGTGQPEKAAEQMKVLDANPPTDPALVKALADLKIVMAAAPTTPGELTSVPEQTTAEKLRKAQIALGMEDGDDAARLYRLVLHDDPANIVAGSGLIGLLLRQEKRSEAMQVADDALKAKPDDTRWISVKKQLAANTPEAQYHVQQELINQISDPTLRALKLADLSLAFNDMPAAVKHFADAEKAGPKDRRVLVARITFLLRQKKVDDAARAVDAAAAANADGMSGLSLRTQFALGQQDHEGALKYGNQMVSQYGDLAVSWFLYGKAQQAAGQLRDAVGSMDAALQRQSNLTQALQTKAVCLEALGQYADEKSAIAQARRLAPNDRTLRDLEMNWELHHGDSDKVVATCQDLLAKEPQNVVVYAAFAQASRGAADAKYRGDPVAYKQVLEKARAVLDDGFKRFSQSPEVASLYGPQAMVLDGLGDAAGAENALKLLAARPELANSPMPSVELAKFYETHNRLPEAEAQWKDAYAKSGQSVEALLTLAKFYAGHGRPEDALKALPADSTDRRIQQQRIEVLLSMKDRLADAKAALVAAYGASPTDSIALYYRGIIELSTDPAAAVRDLTSARDKDPDNVMTRMWLARALLTGGHRDDAVVQLEYVLQRAPLRDDARQLLLNAYYIDPARWVDFDRVVLEAEQSPALNNNPEWYQMYSRGLARRGQYGPAKEQIVAAQKLAPAATELQDEYVNILIQAKDWKDVLSETDKQLAAGRKEGVIYGRQGVARAGLGDKAAALHDFDTSIATYKAAGNPTGIADIVQTIDHTVSPDEALARMNLLPDSPGRDKLMASIFGEKQDFARQLEVAEKMLTKWPNLADDQKADINSTIAEAYLATSQWDKARKAYDSLLKYRPNDLVVLNNVAYLLADKLKAPLDAKSYSKRAYDYTISHDGTPGIIDSHGWILTLCGGVDAKEGLKILQNLVDSNQNLTKSRYHLASALMRAGRTAEAEQQIKIVQTQVDEMQKNKQPIDPELLDGLQKIIDEVRQKAGVPH